MSLEPRGEFNSGANDLSQGSFDIVPMEESSDFGDEEPVPASASTRGYFGVGSEEEKQEEHGQGTSSRSIVEQPTLAKDQPLEDGDYPMPISFSADYLPKWMEKKPFITKKARRFAMRNGQSLSSGAEPSTAEPPTRNPLRLLRNELISLYNHIKPMENEHVLREWLIGRVRESVYRRFGDPRRNKDTGDKWADVIPFGSFTNRLYLPTGDIDVVVLTNHDISESDLMKQVTELIKAQNYAERKTILPLFDARVPILKFTDKRSLLQMDISFRRTAGVESSEVVNHYLKDERIGESLRVLLLFLKFFLYLRGMHEPFTGGVGSYALTLMVVSFFQMHPLLHDHPTINPYDYLGALLIDFFVLYGTDFDYEHYGISVVDGGGYFRKNKNRADPNRVSLLSIEDPQNPEHDVGANSYRIREIAHEFKEAHRTLKDALEEQKLNPTDQQQVSFLSKLVSIPGKFTKQRDKLGNLWVGFVSRPGPPAIFHAREQVYLDLARGVEPPPARSHSTGGGGGRRDRSVDSSRDHSDGSHYRGGQQQGPSRRDEQRPRFDHRYRRDDYHQRPGGDRDHRYDQRYERDDFYRR